MTRKKFRFHNNEVWLTWCHFFVKLPWQIFLWRLLNKPQAVEMAVTSGYQIDLPKGKQQWTLFLYLPGATNLLYRLSSGTPSAPSTTPDCTSSEWVWTGSGSPSTCIESPHCHSRTLRGFRTQGESASGYGRGLWTAWTSQTGCRGSCGNPRQTPTAFVLHQSLVLRCRPPKDTFPVNNFFKHNSC